MVQEILAIQGGTHNDTDPGRGDIEMRRQRFPELGNDASLPNGFLMDADNAKGISSSAIPYLGWQNSFAEVRRWRAESRVSFMNFLIAHDWNRAALFESNFLTFDGTGYRSPRTADRQKSTGLVLIASSQSSRNENLRDVSG
jgi:hypothetical protein